MRRDEVAVELLLVYLGSLRIMAPKRRPTANIDRNSVRRIVPGKLSNQLALFDVRNVRSVDNFIEASRMVHR